MRGRLSAAVAAAVVALGIAVPSAAADTEGPPVPVDVFQSEADFSFTDQAGIAWFGIGLVEDDQLGGTRHVSFFFSGSGSPEPCDAGTPDDPSDDYETGDSIEFFATRSRIVYYRLEPDLSRAVVALALSGQRVRYDGCTGELESSRTEHHTFGYTLHPTSTPETSVDVFCRDDGAGGTVKVTERLTLADATGKAVLDLDPVTVESGSLQHFEQLIGDPC